MFGKDYETRLSLWRSFRGELEVSDTPFIDAIRFYEPAPTVSIHTDPWDKSTWPNPWELVYENQYCAFCKLLGVCYSLQLTERFKHRKFEIHIVRDSNNSDTIFLLFIGDICVGYDYDKTVSVADLPKNLYFENSYLMPPLR